MLLTIQIHLLTRQWLKRRPPRRIEDQDGWNIHVRPKSHALVAALHISRVSSDSEFSLIIRYTQQHAFARHRSSSDARQNHVILSDSSGDATEREGKRRDGIPPRRSHFANPAAAFPLSQASL
jgi:hypothetical protein